MTQSNSAAQSYSYLRYEQEQFWVDSYSFLLTQGYQLRSRYSPAWVPSWASGRTRSNQYEDRLAAVGSEYVLDATRIRDATKIILKRVPNDGDEIRIITFLSSPSLRSDPRNRTIPLLDIIPVPESSWSFLVMPYCRVFNYPPFHCRNEFIEAMSQFLGGLQFMHEHNIAHYDIAPQNMVMDESRVVPNGSHFIRPRTHTGFQNLFSWNDRCTVGPVDYYYIDFGLSLYFPHGKDTALCTGLLRTFPDIPELSLTVPYNPFKVDIFQLGLAMHKLIDAYPALEAFRPVADNLTAVKPSDRSTPVEALTLLRSIGAALAPSILSEQIWQRDTGLWKKMARMVLGGYRYDNDKSSV